MTCLAFLSQHKVYVSKIPGLNPMYVANLFPVNKFLSTSRKSTLMSTKVFAVHVIYVQVQACLPNVQGVRDEVHDFTYLLLTKYC